MGIISSLFGSKRKQSSGLPTEINHIFEKVAELMEDESLQNTMNNPMAKDKIINGLDVDQLPHGIGEFGRSAENPIPVNGSLGN